MAIRYSSSSGTPFGDTANRPSSPQVGQTYYNGQLGYLEIYTVSGWIPATGANDFSLNITGTNTTVTFSQTYSSGSYSIVSFLNDATLDIYAYATDGSLAGYTNTKAFTATQRFNKMVIIGGSAGDVLQFSYKTTYATSTSTTDVTAGPYITSVTPSGMPNQNDTITITGGNFATNVAVEFTGTGYSSTSAKSVVRSSSTSLIVTRPDNFPISASPYTVTVTNPSVANQPTGSAAHIYSGITAGVVPVWNTSTVLPSFTKNTAYSTTVSATDPDGGTITYSYVSGSLPTGLSFNPSTATISGTPSTSADTSYTIRATDSGGNYTDRTFTVKNIGPTWVTSGNINNYISGSAYSYQLSATDDSGDAPIYTLTSGSLPSGLSLSSSGLISGTSSADTTNTFTVTATDANGNASISNSIIMAPGPSVSGGTLSSDSTYYYRTFTGNGNLVVSNSNLQCDYLIVAGGGGGGRHSGAGGGGGGLIYKTSQTLSPATYAASIGGGGAGETNSYPSVTSGNGSNGINTTFNSLTAFGGGGGGCEASGGLNGGSGGGAGRQFTGGSPTQTGTDNFGYAGGGNGSSTDTTAPGYPGHGGGGAGEAGQLGSASGYYGGRGGNGKLVFGNYYAGGGGGNIQYWSSGTDGNPPSAALNSGGAGGLGGGGQGGGPYSDANGSYEGAGRNGTINTGGGGGGSRYNTSFTTGRQAAGGSGIVIVRYTRAQVGG